MEPYRNCAIKKDCTFVVCLLKYPGKSYKLIGQNRKIQIFEKGRLIAEIPVKHSGRKECDYCEVYHASFFKFDKALESKFELVKNTIPQMLGPNISSKEDWKEWFDELGITERFWNNPKRYFFAIAAIRGLEDPEQVDKRKRFEEMIEREWVVGKTKPEDRLDLFWHTLLMNFGLTELWHEKQKNKTVEFQERMTKLKKAHKKLERMYLKIEKVGTIENLPEKEIDAVKKEIERDMLEFLFYPSMPIYAPKDWYTKEDQYRPPDQGFLEFIHNFAGLLKNIKGITDARIFNLISIFYNCFLGKTLTPSTIKKAYLRSVS